MILIDVGNQAFNPLAMGDKENSQGINCTNTYLDNHLPPLVCTWEKRMSKMVTKIHRPDSWKRKDKVEAHYEHSYPCHKQ